MDTGLYGKHAVVTGASGGIGIETVRMFLSEGTKVTGTYNSSMRNLESLQEEWPDKLHLVKVDQTDESEVESMFRQANEKFGRVDILVANVKQSKTVFIDINNGRKPFPSILLVVSYVQNSSLRI